ncbi:MAG: D-alanyl-D-alanine carboxypeptidase [Magnetococcales bacterium]|nr:D-alanyl-D-alanine carboxypeptidase [Magnetococcales bacterium]
MIARNLFIGLMVPLYLLTAACPAAAVDGGKTAKGAKSSESAKANDQARAGGDPLGKVDASKLADLDKGPFQINAPAAILGDIDSGSILYAQEDQTPMHPASLTKVMTLYLVYDALARGDLKLEQKLQVSEKAWRMSGSKTFVQVGDQVKVEDLILGIAVQSGNDACIVVAEHLAGSEEAFAELMNRKAKQLGMAHSHFDNASGMPSPNHMTTARDMFLLARAIKRDFPQYAHYSQEKQYSFNGIRQYNRNRLLWRDSSITGLKTGHTKDAGYCLIATNDKDGQRLAAVIMGAKSSRVREDEALRLLRYGNRLFETVRIFEAKAVVRNLRVWKGQQERVDGIVTESLHVTVPRKERSSMEVGLVYDEPLVAPLLEGAQVGHVVVKLAGKEIVNRPVVAATAIPSGGFFRVLIDTIRMYLGW